MQEQDQPAKNEWLAPANILALFGMLGMAFSSYQAFQRDTSERVVKLEYRIDADERNMAVLQAARDDQAKVNNDLAIRLDRIEHRR